jgi:hypothetical protein
MEGMGERANIMGSPDQSTNDKKKEVEEFLARFRAKMAIKQGFMFWRKDEVIEELNAVGMSIQETPHDQRPGDVWIFGQWIAGKLFYIKLLLNDRKAMCCSFHEAKFDMDFPLENEE